MFVVFRCADAQDRQDRANKTLVNVKAGIEHLADKLQHLKAVRMHSFQTENDYVLSGNILTLTPHASISPWESSLC